MRSLFYTTAFCLGASMAQAEGHYSDLIARLGPTGAAAALAELPNPTPSDAFALGGTRFLGVIEQALQTRYHYGMTGELTDMLDLPLLRLPVEDNHAPATFTPAVLNQIFAEAIAGFDAVPGPLDTIQDTDQVSVVIDTSALWFDINANGTRDTGEGFFDITGDSRGLDPSGDTTLPVIQFDTADAAWLSAYGHLLSGLSNAILSLDPAQALDTTLTTGAALDAIRDAPLNRNYFWVLDENPASIDIIAALLIALESQPDPALTRAALTHFRATIADNKVFWARVATETDNDNEWIPNATQQSALPLTFPPDTAERWQAVLSDAEGLLNGELLWPHWRLGDTAGIDIAAALQNPPQLDLFGIFQGRTLLPYARKGPLADSTNLRAFEQMIGGNSPLFVVILN